MDRIGLWGAGTAFDSSKLPQNNKHSNIQCPEQELAKNYKSDFQMFASQIEPKRSNDQSAMELVALDMKQRGMYQSRQLSFTGAEVQA